MKSEKLLWLETVLVCLYVLGALGFSFYCVHFLIGTYEQISLSMMEPLVNL
jgi:hypothetical protein